MANSVPFIRFAVLALLLAVALGAMFGSLESAANGRSPYLAVHFLDVGQGDAILIETPDGIDVLVDGGPDGNVLRQLGTALALRDRYIDLIVGTHQDKDHIGGLTDVLERYEVGAVLMTENEGESSAASRFVELVENEDAKVVYARRGHTIALGATAELEVLFPVLDPSEMESNASSIVLQLRYGDVEFLLTGDSPTQIEEYLVSVEGSQLQSEVLKAGHHGSRTSTGEAFLNAVDPEYVVITAGKDNRYGHPHQEVLDLLETRGVEIHSTAKDGTVTFLSDGSRVWIE